jgi:type IV secretory pathway protease TraF
MVKSIKTKPFTNVVRISGKLVAVEIDTDIFAKPLTIFSTCRYSPMAFSIGFEEIYKIAWRSGTAEKHINHCMHGMSYD